jgi:hypothetical protein
VGTPTDRTRASEPPVFRARSGRRTQRQYRQQPSAAQTCPALQARRPPGTTCMRNLLSFLPGPRTGHAVLLHAGPSKLADSKTIRRTLANPRHTSKRTQPLRQRRLEGPPHPDAQPWRSLIGTGPSTTVRNDAPCRPRAGDFWRLRRG